MNETTSTAEKTYQADSGAALLAFQRGEIGYAEWNRTQGKSVTAYYTAKTSAEV